jgi:hypothetical protein
VTDRPGQRHRPKSTGQGSVTSRDLHNYTAICLTNLDANKALDTLEDLL